MNKEQLFDAIDRIDDKYVSETEHYDPETMKIRAFPYIYIVPLAFAAASVVAVLIAGHSIRPGNIPGGPEIDNNVLTGNTSYSSELSDTSYSETPYGAETLNGTENLTGTDSETTETGTATETAEGVPDITSAGGLTEKPVTQNGAQTPGTVKTSDKANVTGKITSPVPTNKPTPNVTVPQTLPVTTRRPQATAAYTWPETTAEQHMETTEADFVTEPWWGPPVTTAATSAEASLAPSAYPSGSPAWPSSPSPSAYPTPSAAVSPSASAGVMPTSGDMPEDPPTPYYSPSPLSPVNPDNIYFSDFEELAEAIRNYDPDDSSNPDYPMEKLKSDGYIYALKEPEYYGAIMLLPYLDGRDTAVSIGLVSSDLTMYSADKDKLAQCGSKREYIESITGRNLYKLNSDDVWYTNRGAYFFIDDEHYCYIRSSAEDTEIKRIIESLEFEKIVI